MTENIEVLEEAVLSRQADASRRIRVPNELLDQAQAMGFGREQAESVLQRFNLNIEEALNFLLANPETSPSEDVGGENSTPRDLENVIESTENEKQTEDNDEGMNDERMNDERMNDEGMNDENEFDESEKLVQEFVEDFDNDPDAYLDISLEIEMKAIIEYKRLIFGVEEITDQNQSQDESGDKSHEDERTEENANSE